MPDREESCIKYPPLGELIETFTPEVQEKAYQLLRGAFSQGNGAYRGVALIGLRGGGKSTLASGWRSIFRYPLSGCRT